MWLIWQLHVTAPEAWWEKSVLLVHEWGKALRMYRRRVVRVSSRHWWTEGGNGAVLSWQEEDAVETKTDLFVRNSFKPRLWLNRDVKLHLSESQSLQSLGISGSSMWNEGGICLPHSDVNTSWEEMGEAHIHGKYAVSQSFLNLECPHVHLASWDLMCLPCLFSVPWNDERKWKWNRSVVSNSLPPHGL